MSRKGGYMADLKSSIREAYRQAEAATVAESTPVAEAPKTSTVESTNVGEQKGVQEKTGSSETLETKEQKTGEESSDTKENPVEESQKKSASKNDFSFKADGKMVSPDSLEKLKEYASYGYHTSEKLREVKLKEMQLNNIMNDPEVLVKQLQSKGFDLSKYVQKESEPSKQNDLLPIDPDFDLDSDILYKKTINDLNRKLQFQDQILGKLHENHETSNWMMSFKNTQKQYEDSGYTVPDNAAMAISALMNALQQKYGNQYTTSQYMQGAFREYVDALPNYNISEDVVKANPSIYDKIKRDIIAEYNSQESKRKEASQTPKVSGSRPVVEKEEEVEHLGSFLSTMSKLMNKKK